MAQIRWSLTAAGDVEQHEAYLARDSAVYAARLTAGILSAVEKVAEFPNLGRLVPEFQREDLRELVYGSYRIVYLREDEGVTGVRVVHGSRDLHRVFAGETWVYEE